VYQQWMKENKEDYTAKFPQLSGKKLIDVMREDWKNSPDNPKNQEQEE